MSTFSHLNVVGTQIQSVSIYETGVAPPLSIRQHEAAESGAVTVITRCQRLCNDSKHVILCFAFETRWTFVKLPQWRRKGA